MSFHQFTHPRLSDASALRWGRVLVGLRYSPCGGKLHKAHPAFVIRAVLYAALGKQGGETDPIRFTWHFLNTVIEDRLSAGHDYVVAVIVSESSAAEAAERLIRHFEKSGPLHFEVYDPPRWALRSVEDLLEEHPPPPEPGESGRALYHLELRFETPWAFPSTDPERPWHPGTEKFFDAITRSPAPLLGKRIEVPATDWPALRLDAHHWSLIRWKQPSRSQKGKKQWLSGYQGRIYLTGEYDSIRPLWPFLLIASEFHLGPGKPLGQGRFVVSRPTPHLDPILVDPEFWLDTWKEWMAQVDPLAPPEPIAPPGEEEAAITEIVRTVASGTWSPDPVRVIEIPKTICASRGQANETDTREPFRPLGLMSPRDQLVHRVLNRLLYPPIDRLLSPSAVGFRKGRSVQTAHRRIAHSFRQGESWVAESDIEHFFDRIPLSTLLGKLDDALPPGDTGIRQLLEQVLRANLQRGDIEYARGDCGITQGSSLSPLLSNLYLADFDRSISESGVIHIRFADDFILVGKTRNEVKAALTRAGELLAPLGLSLKAEKTAIHDASTETFRFLGREIGAGADTSAPVRGEEPDRPLKRPLYLSTRHHWAGCEGESVVVREGPRLVARAPLARISEIIAVGLGGVSLNLLDACRRQRIPVTLCREHGDVIASLYPETKKAEDLLYAHHRRHGALEKVEMIAAARDLVAAKLDGYLCWLRDLPGKEPRSVVRELQRTQSKLPEAESIETLFGLEGSAARRVFPLVNQRLIDPAFHSKRRAPRERADRWNVLLDIGYHLLFTRIHAQVRSLSLSPWLGFLHSAENRYPSLVCDLQEPYRARIDRMLSRLVNRREIKPDDFEWRPDGQWRLKSTASPVVVEAFEAEMDARLRDESSTMRRLIYLHVHFLRQWAEGKSDLSLRFQTGKKFPLESHEKK